MKHSFTQLGLMEPLLRAIREQGYDTPTSIQSQAIPLLLKGRDLLGIAQTGTGKTAAFALPILDYLARDPMPRVARKPSALVLTPTRELAVQIADSFGAYGRHVDIRYAAVFGGVSQVPQVKALRRGLDILVATPGRLIDLMQQGHVDLSAVEVFVLDEADRMLDMGFLPAVRKVLQTLPRKRQSLLFSATMPENIVELAASILHKPTRVEVTPPATTVERIDQCVLHVDKKDKRELLAEVLRDPALERVLVFTRTKHGADRVSKHLRQIGESADAIHGDKSQGARQRALESFRRGKVKVLVATDIAARGIDVADITHVVNFDLPNEPESYVHRIGRTARAGRGGVAISFCSPDERRHLHAIERETRNKVRVVDDHGFVSKQPVEPVRSKNPAGDRQWKQRQRRRRGGRPAAAASA